MRSIASVLVMVLAVVSWTTCAGGAGESPMACCVKVQHLCPKVQMKICCPARQQTNPGSSAARLEPAVRMLVESNAGLLALSAVLPTVQAPFRAYQPSTEVGPPTRHSIDCILLI